MGAHCLYFFPGVHCVANVKKGTLDSHWINCVKGNHLIWADSEM